MSISRRAVMYTLVWVTAGAFAQTEAEFAYEPIFNTRPSLPFDVVFPKPVSDEQSLQDAYEEFAWTSLLALNQPLSETNPQPLWHSWSSVDALLSAPDSKPPTACATLAANKLPVVHEIAKSPGLLTGHPALFPSAPVIDQNGEYLRYESRINPSMYDEMIVRQSQSSAEDTQPKPVNFACGDVSTGTSGAIMLQAAWKILSARDDAQRFHTMEALVYTPGQEKPRREARCEQQTLGLVGLHIARKTVSAPSWIWASFEHSDNVPVQGERPDKPAYNFYNWQCRDCPINQMPPEPWNPNRSDSPTQIVRLTALAEATMARNARYHALLRTLDETSAWQYYDLIGVQWSPLPGAGCSVPYQAQAPLVIPNSAVLANTMLETYLQEPFSEPAANCMECHFQAVDTDGNPADFVYFLGRTGNHSE